MNSNKPDLLDRVRADLDRGDHWLARQRLESHLSTVGYDAEILSKLGDIASAMHDGFAAGRYYLTSASEGPNVDTAVATLVRHLRSDPKHIAAQLPHVIRTVNPDRFPEAAVRRIRDLNLQAAIKKTQRGDPSKKSHEQGGRVGMVVAVLIAVLMVVFAPIGFVMTIVRLFE